MKNVIQKAQKFCFSYVRFSTLNQQDGNSEDRQDATFLKVVSQYGWTPRNDWNVVLRGVSAYKGDNLPHLRNVLAMVKDGTIPQGTVMVIETFDRYSRRKISEVFPLLWEMLTSGLEIWVEDMYLTKATLDDDRDLSDVMKEIKSAYRYSEKLSGRVTEALQGRTEKVLNGEKFRTTRNGETVRVLLGAVPAWIDKEKWTLNGKAEIIASIFADYLNNLGAVGIARKLNANGVKTFSFDPNKPNKDCGKWSQSFVYRMFSDRRVIGELKVKNETVKGYYPSAIDEEIFLKVQAKLEANRGTRPVCTKENEAVKVKNLFQGVGYCTCGEKIKVGSGKGGFYMGCYAKVNGTHVCNQPYAKYSTYEAAALLILRLNPTQLLTDDNGNGMNAQMQILNGRKAMIEAEVTKCGKMLDKAITDDLGDLLASINARLKGAKKQLTEVESQIAIESAKTVANKGSLERLAELLTNIHNVTTDQTFRVTVQAWFKETVNKIIFDRVSKTIQIDLKNGSLIDMDLNGTILGTKSLTAMFSLTKNVTVNTANVVDAEKVNWTIDSDAVANVLHRVNKVA